MLNDLLISTKIKEGDIKAFEAFFRRYYSSLCFFAAGITGSYEAAEEIIEELFYKLWQNRETINIFHSLKSYLYGAAKNQSLQYIEHCKIKDKYAKIIKASNSSANNENPQAMIEYRELESIVNTTLLKMPARRMQIFRMHRNEGKKYSEIAQSLSLSVKTVEAEISKSLKLLRVEIEQYTHYE